MAALTEQMLISRSGQFDLESIQRVQLSRLALGKIEILQLCTSLVSLDLSGNMVTDLTGLGNLPKLKTLDASQNRIRSLNGLEGLTALETLNLQGNAISTLEELEQLAHLTQLRSLNLQEPDGSKANPVCGHPAYFSMVQRMIGQHKLQQIDGENLLLREAAQKLMMETAGPDESDIELPPSEPWGEDRLLRLPKPSTDRATLELANAIDNDVDEAKSLDAEAAILVSKIKADAVAQRQAAAKLMEEASAEESRQATRTSGNGQNGGNSGGGRGGGAKRSSKKRR